MDNSNLYISIVEKILYDKEINTTKDWGHIWWYSSPNAYCLFTEWSKLEDFGEYIYKNKDDIFVQIIKEWKESWYLRKALKKNLELFDDSYLLNFIYAISYSKYSEKNYYFRFSESIDQDWAKYLKKSLQINPNYLFSNIALASYYKNNQNFELSLPLYIKSLTLDKKNPNVLANISMLYSSIWWEENLRRAEKLIRKAYILIPNSPWVNAWYWEILNKIWKYYEALVFFEKYEELTKWKHRTFEPFLRKAESFIWLSDYSRARSELEKEKEYYFWEWYRYVYNNLNKELEKHWY